MKNPTMESTVIASKEVTIKLMEIGALNNTLVKKLTEKILKDLVDPNEEAISKEANFLVSNLKEIIKYYGKINNEEDLNEYLSKIAYRVAIKPLWEINNKKYYAIKETTPNLNELGIYMVYTENGILYNNSGDDIILVDIENY